MNDSVKHPALDQFRKAMQDCAVTPDKAVAFNKWRNNPDKCTGPVKEAADQLWAEYESTKPAANSGAPASRTTPPSSASHNKPSHRSSGGGYQSNQHTGQPQRADNASAAEPDILGEAFHNPYTFIPFPQKPPKRHTPTPLSIDELEGEHERFTGILDLNIKLLSPLLSNSPEPVKDDGGHKTYAALTIGDDVIVPATGVRGALRTLMTILTGGTLGYIDDEAWLCQGRDARLGPDKSKKDIHVPHFPHLAQIYQKDSYSMTPKLQLGETRLVDIKQIAHAIAKKEGKPVPQEVHEPGPKPQRRNFLHNEDYRQAEKEYYRKRHEYKRYLEKLDGFIMPYRPHHDDQKKRLVVPTIYAAIEGSPERPLITEISFEPTVTCTWQLKLAQRCINLGDRRPKLEGAFRPDPSLPPIDISRQLWRDYTGRHRHADFGELQNGYLVWLQPKNVSLSKITATEEIASIQCARWGREGENLLSIIRQRHPHQLPDAFNPDGLVDEVTDLFGQTPREDIAQKTLDKNKPAVAFAARIRPCNLVFPQAKSKVQRVTLAPLAPPHPGCAAFYRALSGDLASAADHVSNHKTPLRGYKVYRTTTESGTHAPWLFKTQGVYGDRGELKSEQQKVNKTCDLLPPDNAPVGTLRITVRALSRRELTLLLAACAVDWRLGGGKPLGLGHCRVVSATLRQFHDDGTLGPAISIQRASDAIALLPEPFATELAEDAQLVERMHLWQTSQTPVQKLRYPRAVVENRNRKSRGGHVWFQRHASPRKAAREGDHPQGLQVMHLGGQLRDEAHADALRAQPLPPLEASKPEADVLYGYDLFVGEGPEWTEQTRDRRTLYRKLEPFDEKKHARPTDKSGGFHGQTRDSRQNTRRQRR